MNPSPETSAPANGERKLHAQEVRRATPQVLLVVLGLVAGIVLALSEENWLPRLPPALAWLGAALLAAAVVGLNAIWIRRVDEVEISDQLWSSFVGLQAFILTATCWELLAATGAAPPVHRYGLYLATFTATCAAYFWRRLRRT
jgi:drug/metabolite transporter (DMT)-like permease